MKKIFASLIILFSATSLAADNFNTSTGVLEIPELNINSVPYGSATLKLDLSKGTFSVLEAKPRPVSGPPIQDPFISNGYTFTPLGCKRSGTTEVTCEMQIVNNLNNKSLSITNNGYASILKDDFGNIYNLSKVLVDGKFVINYVPNYWSLPTMYQNVPTKIGFVFDGVDGKAKSIPKFVIEFYEPSIHNSFDIIVLNCPL